jgi:hypothetical protein
MLAAGVVALQAPVVAVLQLVGQAVVVMVVLQVVLVQQVLLILVVEVVGMETAALPEVQA